MTQIKTAMTTVFALLILLTGYTYFTFGDMHKFQQAYISYLKGDYSKSEEILGKVSDKNLEAQKLLYLSYIARDQGKSDISKQYLEKAAESIDPYTPSKVHLEVILNQALSSYLSNDLNSMGKAIAELKVTPESRNDRWASFFQSLYNNELNASERDVSSKEEDAFWKETAKIPHLSQWMKSSFFKIFTPFWQEKNQIKYLINRGKYTEARGVIEVGINRNSDAEKGELYLLMAHSYIKEAQSKPPVIATPYYKLAFNYYKKAPFYHKESQKERDLFIEESKKQISALSKEKMFSEIEYPLTLLDQLDDRPDKKHLSETLVALVEREEQQSERNNIDALLSLLKKTLPDSEVKKSLAERFHIDLCPANASSPCAPAKSYTETPLKF